MKWKFLSRRRTRHLDAQLQLRTRLLFPIFITILAHCSRGIGGSFRTMDGHGTAVFIHPSSAVIIGYHKTEWCVCLSVCLISPRYM